MRKIGLIVNPIAGLGGPAGLKGTDGPGLAAMAVARGARPAAGDRAGSAVDAFVQSGGRALLLTAAGDMGAGIAAAAGLDHAIVHRPCARFTDRQDTQATARAAVANGAEAIVFAGGDGTVRDILEAIGTDVPLLGIPCGVKMQSGVFATGPATAGRLLAAWLNRDGPPSVRRAEVMDIDEDALRAGHVAPRLFGYADVPAVPSGIQHPKAGPTRADDAALAAAARELVREFEPGTGVVVGPGTSAKGVCAALGVSSSLLGLDVILDGALLAADVSRDQLADCLRGRPVRIVVGVTGGQGFVFGRGNQPLGPEIVRRAGRAGLTILAGRNKLALLPDPWLLVDTGDPDLDRELAGHARVVTGAGEYCIMRLVAA
jgi:predicted polyphosphate/ATP-dependent NAD kinase